MATGERLEEVAAPFVEGRERALTAVLYAIRESRGDPAPVFAAIMESATRLCDAPFACVFLKSAAGTHLEMVAHSGARTGLVEMLSDRGQPIDDPYSHSARVVRENLTSPVQIEDLTKDEFFQHLTPQRAAAVGAEGMRTLLIVPLVTDGEVTGEFFLYRREVRRFTDAQIALVEAFATQAAIAIDNVNQYREVQTRLEREAATREILQVISKSREDEAPVFEAILDSALRLCGAPLGLILLGGPEDTHLVPAAQKGGTPEWMAGLERNPAPRIASESLNSQAAIECRVVHVEDIRDTDLYRSGQPLRRMAVDQEGMRSSLAVPLISGGVGIGTICLYRREVKPFTAQQIELLQTFAAQAVIAVENVRQFRELQSRLEREKATSGILSVISQSPDDDSPVFEAIHEHVARLCDAPFSGLFLTDPDGEHLNLVSHVGANPEYSVATGSRWSLSDRSAMARAVTRRDVVHIADMRDTPGYRAGDVETVRAADEEGIGTFLAVPLMHHDRAIGCIGIYRREVRPFSDDEINLVRTFAAQAVIAIENVRQFRELQTRLEREAATSEILGVISRSRDDEQPIFEAIIENAQRLCEARMAAFVMGEEGGGPQVMVAHRGATEETLRLYREGRFPMDPEVSTAARAIVTRQTIHLHDMADTDGYRQGHPNFVSLVDQQGIRTNLLVPLISQGRGIGCLILFRDEIRPYSDDQVALVRTFAAQAVIAIENVRQFRELQARLEREEASRRILDVISQSRDDEVPVFNIILECATRLIGSPLAGLHMLDESDGIVRLVAHSGVQDETLTAHDFSSPVDAPVIVARAVRECAVMHRPDLTADSLYTDGNPLRTAMVDVEGARTALVVPLISGGAGIGCIWVFRREVRAYDDDEIGLLQGFAAQAVIAIENVRQFRELQARLEREEATGEILSVISRSRDDSQPVFEVILENAVRLCQATNALLFLADEKRGCFELVAQHGARSATVEALRTNPTPLSERAGEVFAAFSRNEIRQVEDLADTDLYREGNPYRRIAVDDEGVRALLTVPLLQNSRPIGVFMLYRREPRRFDDNQVDLVKTFAAQAAIAIENVHQFRELQARLEREEATRQILQVISRSRDDSGPVFDLILADALRLCRAEFGMICDHLPDDTHVRVVAHRGLNEQMQAMYRDDPPPMDVAQSTMARCILNREVVHVDTHDPDVYPQGSRHGAMAAREGIRTGMTVPLLIDDRCVGAITLFRREKQFFDADQIELLQIFAAQAAIAIENVRQFRTLVEARDDAEAALADLKRAQERLVQSEKMASLGQLTAGIAHEIKNPLNFVNNFARLSGEMVSELAEILEGPIAALDEEDRDDAEDLLRTVRENLGKIDEHGRRADSIVKNMLLHSREGPSQRQTGNVNTIAAEALNLAYHGARAENSSFNIKMKTDLAEDAGRIECYPQDLMRVFLNIISNGMYAAYGRSVDEDGFAPEITVSSRRDGDRVIVEVRDNGMGIPANVREKIFTPFFTTKPAGEGTGLGLSLSYDIVIKQHGGDLTVDSEPGRFTAFTVSLPRALPAENGGSS